MPAQAGKSKRDAGKFQKNPHKKGPVKASPPPEPVEGDRPTLPEVPPLFHTYDQPKPEGSYFDEAAANHAVNWIESNIRQYQGRWKGRPLYLLAWQARLVRELFGWKRADGTRLHRVCYLEVPRKAGKSTLASAIALYLSFGDGEAGPQIYFAAYDKDQASVCYKTARFMVEGNPELEQATARYNSSKEMLLVDNPGGILKATSADGAKQYGLNLHGLIFDELMTQKTRILWDSLTTAQGSREQPLIFAISTAGWDKQSICFEQHEYTRKISEGAFPDPTFLGVIYGAPEDADWTLLETAIAANPSLGDPEQGATVTLDYYREAIAKAQEQPTAENAYRTLYTSQWVGQSERVVPMADWDACTDPVKLDGPAFGGLDLSTTTDLTSFVLAFWDDPYVDLLPFFFIPGDNIRDRSSRDRVDYDTWVRQGFVIATPGPTVNYGVVKATILQAAEDYDLRTVGYDRWNSSQVVQELEDEGMSMQQLGQGWQSMSAPTKELLRLVVSHKLRHGQNPVLRWNADNAAAKQDPAGNIKPAKDRSAGRIDGIVASIIAIDGLMRGANVKKPVSAYETRGLEAI